MAERFAYGKHPPRGLYNGSGGKIRLFRHSSFTDMACRRMTPGEGQISRGLQGGPVA